jgi:histidyl-tRNA synthetase
MESLGGAPTPAVGWAAGIERLAMLVGAREEERLEAVVLVEHDGGLSIGLSLLARLRAEGVSAEIVATGSPKKRYDKAVKLRPKHILRVNENAYYAISGDGPTDRIVAAIN